MSAPPPPFDKLPEHLGAFRQTMGEVIQGLPPGRAKEMLTEVMAKWEEHLAQAGPALKDATATLQKSFDESNALAKDVQEKASALGAKIDAAKAARAQKAQQPEPSTNGAPLAVDPAVGQSLRGELLRMAGLTPVPGQPQYGDVWDEMRKKHPGG